MSIKRRDAKNLPAGKVRPAEAKKLGWFERLKRLRLRFKREGMNVRVLLEDPAQHLADIKRQSKQADLSEAAMFSAALKGVLDRHAASRSVLPHLTVLEQGLDRHGLKVLDKLPPDVVRKALAQMETLVTDWSQGGLAALRARLSGALITHGRDKGRRRVAEQLSEFQDSQRLQVNEASVTTFLEVNAQWERSGTGGARG